MKVFQVVGVRKSGKTATVEILIRLFRQKGLRVASVKCINCPVFTLDGNKSSNTSRHRAAGADVVVAFGRKEVDFIYPGPPDMDKTLQMLSNDESDYCIVEGGYEYDFPRIVCFRELSEIPERLTERTFALSGAGAETPLPENINLPVFSAFTSASQLADLIEEKVPHVSFPVNRIPRPESCRNFCGGCRKHGNISGDIKTNLTETDET